MAKEKNHDDSYNMDESEISNESNNYNIVTLEVILKESEVRLKLLQMVCLEGMKTSKASRILQVNESTAKYIVRTFLSKGKVLEKASVEKSEEDLRLLKALNEAREKLKTKVSSRKAKNSRKYVKNEKCVATTEFEFTPSRQSTEIEVKLEEFQHESEESQKNIIGPENLLSCFYGFYPTYFVVFGENGQEVQ